MEAFSIVAALATAVQAAALIMLHLLPTGYNPVATRLAISLGFRAARFPSPRSAGTSRWR
jgi:hypothetical protein